MIDPAPGVSFVVPVKNGARWIEEVLTAILGEDDGRPFEVIVVEDGSTDSSRELVQQMATSDSRIRLLDGPRAGAAAALNHGIEAAHYPLVAQVDQDVVIHSGWFKRLSASVADPGVAAAQGQYRADRRAPLLARLAGYELELRYRSISGESTDHVCTGNSLYRRQTLAAVGGFDAQLGYGYDNDLSYRLTDAGFELRFIREAGSTHHWRRGLAAFLRQQYGLGYGRLELIAKHPRRISGDRVSGLRMILHVPGTVAALGAALAAIVLATSGGHWIPAAVISGALLTILATDRLLVAMIALRRFRDPGALMLVPVHLLRDLAWVWASIRWGLRRLLSRRPTPGHSMRER